MQLSIAEKMKYLIPGSVVSAIINLIFEFYIDSYLWNDRAAIAAVLYIFDNTSFLFYYGMKVFPLNIDRNKLLSLFILLTFFTLLAYFLYALEIHFILK